MKKKISYIELLKEAISEYDTKSFDVKGPMLDPIISYDGGGELQTHKDASSILERYYFKEKEDESRVFVEQDVQEQEPEENEIETGEEADDVDDTMDDLKDELMEDLMMEEDEEGGEVEDGADVPSEFEKEPGGKFDGMATENMEQAVIEKLISEMEEFNEEDEGPDKEIKTPEDEETGQAGTDLASEKEVDKVVEELELEMLMLEAEEEGEEEEGEEEDGADEEGEKGELDVDKGVKKESSSGIGIVPTSRDQVEEAFRLFKEAIEDTEDKSAESDEKEQDAEKEKEGVVGEDFDIELEMLMMEAEEE